MAATREAAPESTRLDGLGTHYAKLSPGPGRLPSEVAGHQRARIHSAMVELVAERGYDSVPVRQIASWASVSTRAFYKHFSGKEECFLRTYELIVRRAAQRIVASQSGERDWRKRMRLAFRAFARELQRDPQAARFALIEAHRVGAISEEQVRSATLIFETMLKKGFACSQSEIAMPRLFTNAVLAGTESVARSQLLGGESVEPSRLGDELFDWALTFHFESASMVRAVDRHLPSIEPKKRCPEEQLAIPAQSSVVNDRSLILSAVGKLMTASGADGLTVTQIHTAAGVSREKFNSRFKSVNDCVGALLELRISEILKRSLAASEVNGAGLDYPAGQILILCMQVALDPILSRLYLVDVPERESRGLLRRESVIGALADFADSCSRSSTLPGKLALEASVGALFGALRQGSDGGRLPATPASLALLLLVPLMGSDSALQAAFRVGR